MHTQKLRTIHYGQADRLALAGRRPGGIRGANYACEGAENSGDTTESACVLIQIDGNPGAGEEVEINRTYSA